MITPDPNIPGFPPPILMVDDEEVMLMAVRESLRPLGYSLVTFTDPVAAVEEMKQREFSVILTDQRMPVMSGLELLSHAQRLRPDATRVLITAVVNLDTIIEAINKGEIFRFIVKPWLLEELMATIKNSVQRYELICQNARLQANTRAINEKLVDLNGSLEQQVQVIANQNQELARMNAELEANFSRSLDLSINMLQTFHPSLGNQSRRVSQICQGMGAVLQLGAAELRVLVSSARLHDIGLVGVPRDVIRRWQHEPEKLDGMEISLIQRHPILGAELAALGSGQESVGEIIRAHHERFDGTGYPDGLQGDNIPWLGRLLAVAVAYASNRLSAADGLDSVKMGAGTAFDPEAIRVLLWALPLAPLPRQHKEITLADLRPGMILASGIYTGNGQLLLPEGSELSPACIDELVQKNRVQPITDTLVVYC